MKIVNSKELILKAYKNNIAIPAINVSNMETITAVLESASNLNKAVILQVSPLQKEICNFSYKQIINIINIIANDFKYGEYAIHLDHSQSVDECEKAINSGFNSVMFDGSTISLNNNINNLAKLRSRHKDLTIEGELGTVGGQEASNETLKISFTNPDIVYDFVKKTKIDLLAVAIGNCHGVYKGKPNLNYELLNDIKTKANIPLVLHGASGISDEDIKKAIKLGVSKINFFTEIDNIFKNVIGNEIKKDFYSMYFLKSAREEMKKKVEKIISLCEDIT